MNKNRLIGIITVACFIGGIAAVVSIPELLENYFQPLWFIIIFGVIGLASGLFIRRKLNTILERSTPAELIKAYPQFGTVFGFVGFALYFGAMLNAGLSDCVSETSVIQQKISTKPSARKPGVYHIIITVNNNRETIKCSYEYWQTLSTGDTVNVSFRESPIGFDFVELPDGF